MPRVYRQFRAIPWAIRDVGAITYGTSDSSVIHRTFRDGSKLKPMRYVMKQKAFSLGDKFSIQDQNGADAFFVDGRVFSVGHQLAFEDPQGNQLAFIKQTVLSWGPTYEIYRGEDHIATVKKELFTFFQCTFHIHVDGQGDLDAAGDLSDHEYAFTRDGQAVAEVSKQWFTWSDTYGVDIAEGEDAVLILASTVVIDMCCHGDRN